MLRRSRPHLMRFSARASTGQSVLAADDSVQVSTLLDRNACLHCARWDVGALTVCGGG